MEQRVCQTLLVTDDSAIKVRAIAGLPHLMRDGVVVFDGKNPKNEKTRLVVVSGKMSIRGEDFFVTAGLRDGGDGKLFYDHELLEVERVDGLSSQFSRGAAYSATDLTPTSIAHLNDYTLAFLSQVVPQFSSSGAIQAFEYNGRIYVIGDNTSAEAAPGVLLHEATHGKQRADIDARSLKLIDNRDKLPMRKEMRDFLNRVSQRMAKSGEVGNASEASAYLVEMAVLEGRQAGFSAVDGKFMDWMDKTLGKRVGNIVRDFVAMVRGWLLSKGIRFNPSVDDLVELAKLNLKDMAGDGTARFSKVGGGETAFRAPEVRDAQGRILAPNGKPSKLNERQWHQVRSQEFIRWFGNWAYDSAMPVNITKITGKEIGDGPLSASRIKEWVLREQGWQNLPPVINAQTGNAIGFTVQGVKDSLKRKSDQQRQAYAGLRGMLEQSAFVDFEPVRDGKANESHLQGYEIYYAALEIDGKLFGVRLKVELPKSETARDRSYKDHKIVDVEVRSPAASQGSGGKPVIGDPVSGPTQAGGSTVSLGQLVGEIKPVASKVVDENGEPLVVYRTDRTEFNKFDKRKAKEGFFFHSNETAAKAYGGNVREFYLNIVNPLVVPDALPNEKNATDIKGTEFDGVINERNDGNEFISISPTQIKSATGNNGNFDGANPDIRFSIVGPSTSPSHPPAPGNPWQAAKAKAAAILTLERIDRAIYEFQDKMIDLRRLRDHIKDGHVRDLDGWGIQSQRHGVQVWYLPEWLAGS